MWFLLGCQSSPVAPMPVVSYVDLPRFMGDWYVIASIPTPFERDAYNAIEHYALEEEGRVATTFSFNRLGFDGPRKQMRATGFVEDDASNAVWGMQFVWPFKADYRVIHLDEAYSVTVIGREQRDYVWIMARTPTLPGVEYLRLVSWLGDLGYDTKKIEQVPQRWPS